MAMPVMHRGSSGRGLEEDRASQRLLLLLRSEDRELLSIWAGGLVSCRSIARVLGCHSGTVSRRIRQLRDRLNDPIARTVVMHERELPPKHREVAIRVLCQGEKVCPVARDLALARHEAQRILTEVKGWAKLRNSLQGS